MSSFMMYVAVVGAVFPAWANAATGLRTDAITRTCTTVFFIAFLPNVLLLLRRCWPAFTRPGSTAEMRPRQPVVSLPGYCGPRQEERAVETDGAAGGGWSLEKRLHLQSFAVAAPAGSSIIPNY
jgi:hypothetical protein